MVIYYVLCVCVGSPFCRKNYVGCCLPSAIFIWCGIAIPTCKRITHSCGDGKSNALVIGRRIGRFINLTAVCYVGNGIRFGLPLRGDRQIVRQCPYAILNLVVAIIPSNKVIAHARRSTKLVFRIEGDRL